MPKIKTSRTAYKRFKVNAAGKLIRGRSGTSHNTGKRSAKKNRQLRGTALVPETCHATIKRMLPNQGVA